MLAEIKLEDGWHIKMPDGSPSVAVFKSRDAARGAANAMPKPTSDPIERMYAEAFANTPTTNGYQHRETWLHALADKLVPTVFVAHDVSSNVRYSCGFPSKKALLSTKGTALGQCWYPEQSGDDHHEIFISPVIDDPLKVAAVMVHEICHVVAGSKAKHGPVFKKVFYDVGMEDKATECNASVTLQGQLIPILADLGPYPMAALDARRMTTGIKKQTTRLLKVECPMCGYTVRMTKKWVDDVGLPHCPEHGVMELDDTPNNNDKE